MNMKHWIALLLIFIIVLPLQRHFTNTQQLPYSLTNTEFTNTNIKIRNKLAEPNDIIAASQNSIDTWTREIDSLITTIGRRSQQLAREATYAKNKKLREIKARFAATRGGAGPLVLPIPAPGIPIPSDNAPINDFPEQQLPEDLRTMLRNLFDNAQITQQAVDNQTQNQINAAVKQVSNDLETFLKNQKAIDEAKEKIKEIETEVELVIEKQITENLFLKELEEKLLQFIEQSFSTEEAIDKAAQEIIAYLSTIRANIDTTTYEISLEIISSAVKFKKEQFNKIIPEESAKKTTKDLADTLTESPEEKQLDGVINNETSSQEAQIASLKRKADIQGEQTRKRIKLLMEVTKEPIATINQLITKQTTNQKNRQQLIVEPEKKLIASQKELAKLDAQQKNSLDRFTEQIKSAENIVNKSAGAIVPFNGLQTLVTASKENPIQWLQNNPTKFYVTLTGIYNTLKNLLQNPRTKQTLVLDIQSGKYAQAFQEFLLLLQALNKAQAQNTQELALVIRHTIDLSSFLANIFELFKQNGVTVTDASLILQQVNKLASNTIAQNTSQLSIENKKDLGVRITGDPLLLEWHLPKQPVEPIPAKDFRKIFSDEVLAQMLKTVKPIVQELENKNPEPVSQGLEFDNAFKEFRNFLDAIKNEWASATEEGDVLDEMQPVLTKLSAGSLSQLEKLIKNDSNKKQYNDIRSEYIELIETYKEKIEKAEKEDNEETEETQESGEPTEPSTPPSSPEISKPQETSPTLTENEINNLNELNKLINIIEKTDHWIAPTNNKVTEKDTIYTLDQITDNLFKLFLSLNTHDLQKKHFKELNEIFYTHVAQILISIVSLNNLIKFDNLENLENLNDLAETGKFKLNAEELFSLFIRSSKKNLPSLKDLPSLKEFLTKAEKNFGTITNSNLKNTFLSLLKILPKIKKLAFNYLLKEFSEIFIPIKKEWEQLNAEANKVTITEAEAIFKKLTDDSINVSLNKLEIASRSSYEIEEYNKSVQQHKELIDQVNKKIKAFKKEIKNKETTSKNIIDKFDEQLVNAEKELFKRSKKLITQATTNDLGVTKNKISNLFELINENNKRLQNSQGDLNTFEKGGIIDTQRYIIANENLEDFRDAIDYINLLHGLLSNRSHVVDQIYTLINNIDKLTTSDVEKPQERLLQYEKKAKTLTDNLNSTYTLIKNWKNGNLENYIDLFENSTDKSYDKQVTIAQSLKNKINQLLIAKPLPKLIDLEKLAKINQALVSTLQGKLEAVSKDLSETLGKTQQEEFEKIIEKNEKIIQEIIKEVGKVTIKLIQKKFKGDIRTQIATAQDTINGLAREKNIVIYNLTKLKGAYPAKIDNIDTVIHDIVAEYNNAIGSLETTIKKIAKEESPKANTPEEILMAIVQDYTGKLAAIDSRIDQITNAHTADLALTALDTLRTDFEKFLTDNKLTLAEEDQEQLIGIFDEIQQKIKEKIFTGPTQVESDEETVPSGPVTFKQLREEGDLLLNDLETTSPRDQGLIDKLNAFNEKIDIFTRKDPNFKAGFMLKDEINTQFKNAEQSEDDDEDKSINYE